MKKQLGLLSALLLTATATFAQFEGSGEIRPRTEYRNGFGKPITEGTDAGIGTSTRARVNFGYKASAFDFYVSIQDVLTWGENRQIAPVDANNSFNLFQAYVGIKLDSAEVHKLKIGRQVLSYDDQRILGGLDWAQQGRNHDLALYKYKRNSVSFDLGLAYNQDHGNLSGYVSEGNDYNTSGFFTYKTMQFAHFNNKWEKLSLSILAMNNGFQDVAGTGVDDVSNLQTFGAYVDYKPGKLKVRGAAYMQMGDAIYGPNHTEVTGAYLANVDLGYSISKAVTLTLGGEIISGNGETEAGKTSAFFPLYGTNHKFNGYMDYFYVGNHANSIGLVDLHIGAKAKLGKGWGAMVNVLNFQGAEELASGETQLGTELDLVVSKKFKGFVMKGGYSHMFASDGMYELKGVAKDAAKDAQNWAWVMLVFKPKFL